MQAPACGPIRAGRFRFRWQRPRTVRAAALRDQGDAARLDACEGGAHHASARHGGGLETEEGDAHILYSVFWLGGGGDLAVVTTAGTRTDLWSTYAPAFDRMGAGFELIDMTRFAK